MEGLDLNYESDYVRRGSVIDMPYRNQYFDRVLLLDVLEHIPFMDQRSALREIHRVLKPGGIFIATIPNLAHMNSRFRVLFFGDLDRTDSDVNHPGERPLRENRRLLTDAGFHCKK